MPGPFNRQTTLLVTAFLAVLSVGLFLFSKKPSLPYTLMVSSEEATSENINLDKAEILPLKLAQPIQDLCETIYNDELTQREFVLGKNTIDVRTLSSTKSFSRECSFSGDVTTNPDLYCSRVYVSAVGPICKIGSEAKLHRFSKGISASVWLGSITRTYAQKNYGFSLQCHLPEIRTTWQTQQGQKFEEIFKFTSGGTLESVRTETATEQTFYEVESSGRFAIKSLTNPTDKRQTSQYLASFYRPKFFKPEPSTIVPWVNYVSALQECCDQKHCEDQFIKPVEELNSSQQVQVDTGRLNSKPSTATD